MKKHQFFLTALSTLALTACGGASFPSNANTSALDFQTINDQPNRFVLRSLANMMTNPGSAIRSSINVDAEVLSEIILPNYQTTNIFQITADAELAMNTPSTGVGTAELNVDFERFALLSSSSSGDGSFAFESETVVENESAKVYFEDELAYIDLSEDATVVARLLFPSENREFPTQFKTPYTLEALTGNLLPQVTEADIDAWVEASLPMVDSLNLLNKTITGTLLTVGYEITQADLPVIYEAMFLGTNSREDLSEEETAFLDQWLEESLAGITLNAFALSVTVNLLNNLIESLFIDIDVENHYEFEINIPVYDPENPDANEYGYVDGNDPYTLEWNYNYDLEINAQMEVLVDPIILVAPLNKEEYELIELNLEDPNLI
jgi:hypothetical protein